MNLLRSLAAVEVIGSDDSARLFALFDRLDATTPVTELTALLRPA